MVFLNVYALIYVKALQTLSSGLQWALVLAWHGRATDQPARIFNVGSGRLAGVIFGGRVHNGA